MSGPVVYVAQRADVRRAVQNARRWRIALANTPNATDRLVRWTERNGRSALRNALFAFRHRAPTVGRPGKVAALQGRFWI